MIFFLVVLNLAGALFYGFGVKAILPVLIAAAAASSLELLIEYLKSKTWMFPQSALISGLFIGGLLTQGLQWHVYALAGIIAVLSKHLIKIQQKHIFNPANFGVLFVSALFGAAHTWWISSPLILVLAFGIFIIWRMKRLDLALSFLAGYYIINSVIELSKGSSFNDIYLEVISGGILYFFSMYMLIEPNTHPIGKKQRIIYGVSVAVLLILFHAYIPKHDLPLALAAGNILVPILNRLKLGFGKKKAGEGMFKQN